MLVEVVSGLWVHPEQVASVAAMSGRTVGTFEVKPTVQLHVTDKSGVSWEFDTWDAAVAWAEKIATAVNAALQGSTKGA